MAAGRIYRNRWIVVVLTHSQGMPVTSDDISIYRYIKRDRETILDNEMAKNQPFIPLPNITAINIDEINMRSGRSFREFVELTRCSERVMIHKNP